MKQSCLVYYSFPHFLTTLHGGFPVASLPAMWETRV